MKYEKRCKNFFYETSEGMRKRFGNPSEKKNPNPNHDLMSSCEK